jgi:cellulose synthase/poly-beta-1,6-N-acetylglucosamine synthase-like glycosyltransferase
LSPAVYEGAQIEAVSFDVLGVFVRIVTLDAIPASLAFSVLVTLSGLMLAREVYRDRDPDARVDDGPRVAAIVPAYNDADVVSKSVETLLASDYDNLDIVVVCEPNDEATLAEAREHAAHPSVRVIENRYPGSKAGALNDAIERVDAEHLAVFDVDEKVREDFVSRAVHHLTDDDADVFQARRVPRVTGPIEGLAYCERLLFHAGYKLVEPLGFTYCRSSSLVFTREAYEQVDGFDELLTEDIDFAHKCFRAELDVAQARDVTNEMGAPTR